MFANATSFNRDYIKDWYTTKNPWWVDRLTFLITTACVILSIFQVVTMEMAIADQKRRKEKYFEDQRMGRLPEEDDVEVKDNPKTAKRAKKAARKIMDVKMKTL